MSSQPTPEIGDFEYFRDPNERAMIAECGYRVADYLKQEGIGTLVLVDRAARNLYIPVREAFRDQNPDARLPGVYFLNPSGFICPDTHDQISYNSRALVSLLESAETLQEAVSSVRKHPMTFAGAMASGAWKRQQDKLTDKRAKIDEKLTPLFAQAVEHDDSFNGSVLVLDACWHSGSSVKGIAQSLRNIGVIDVRTGVVNDIRSADFVVFEDYEIEDDCKPFGTQRGLTKGEGEKLTSSLASWKGLSDDARLARRELHLLMQQGQELRDDFAESRQADLKVTGHIKRLLGDHIAELFGSATGAGIVGRGEVFRNGGFIEIEIIIPKEATRDD